MRQAVTKPETSSSKTPLRSGLYIVATPIGNLRDITLRAVDILQRCDVVACEDTRVTGKLLKALDIAKPMQRYDDHTSDQARARIVDVAQEGVVALVSDAGTPLISDPGFRLVREAREAGAEINTLPGPCAAIAGLTLSGLPNDRFVFAGFLPTKEKARRDVLDELASVDATLIFYESGPRLVKTLHALEALWPTREISVARELTKLHEECRSGLAAELAAHYDAHPPKGEIVLLIGPPEAQPFEGDPDELLHSALETLKPSQAASQVAKQTGLDRKALYARALELKAELKA